MSISRPLLLLFGLALPMMGCADAIIGADDDDIVTDDDDAAPIEPIFDLVTGTVDYFMTYTDGPLEGEECSESYELTSVDATEQATMEVGRLQEACPNCEILFQGFFNDIDTDCAGGPDLPEDNFLSFDYITQEGSAILWWKAGDDWLELASGEIDWDDVVIEVEDPNTGGWGGWGASNSTNEEPCNGFGNRCQWDGLYVNTFDLGTNEPEETE